MLASCSKSDVVDGGSSDSQVIRLKSGTHNYTVTRTPFVGDIASGNTLGALVLATGTTGDYSDLYAKGTMTFAGGTDPVPYDTPLESGNNKFTGDNSIYLQGLYPATGWTVSTAAQTAVFTFDGTADVMNTAEVETNGPDVNSGTFATLEFEHLLTKLEFRFRADGDNVVATWGKITDMKLVKVGSSDPATVVTLDLTGVADPSFGTTTTGFSCYDMSKSGSVATYTDTSFSGVDLEVVDAAVWKAYTLAAPAVASAADGAYEYQLEITGATKGTQTVSIELYDKNGNKFTGSTAGYSFNIILNFLGEYIVADATVKAWDEGGETELEIE